MDICYYVFGILAFGESTFGELAFTEWTFGE